MQLTLEGAMADHVIKLGYQRRLTPNQPAQLSECLQVRHEHLHLQLTRSLDVHFE
jgi:hypothetical protein